jgi:hypothetical protein
LRAQRIQQRAKGARAVALLRRILDARLGVRSAKLRRLEVRVVAKAAGSTRTLQNAAFNLSATQLFA